MITNFKNELYFNLSNADYHGAANTYSSSQLKDMLEDPVLFYQKYVSKEIGRNEIDAFAVGTYFHTAVLEPHLLEEECAVFNGKRLGKVWDAFKLEHKGKAIITQSEYENVYKMIEAVKASAVCTKYLSDGMPEVSAFLNIWVSGGDVFVPEKNLILSTYGWAKQKANLKSNGTFLTLKVRADYLGNDFVSDLKSTSGNCRLDRLVRDKVKTYQYDLSAALYLDVFSAVVGKDINNFVWIFASKDIHCARAYLASNQSIRVGRAKWKKAVVELAKNLKNNWEFEDSMGVLEPMPWDVQDYINNKSEFEL